MKITLIVPGKFHSFDLARELQERGLLDSIITSYPRFKLNRERIDPQIVRTFPYLHGPYMAMRRREILGNLVNEAWEIARRASLDWYACKSIKKKTLVVALSGVGLKSGTKAQNMGGRYICDRGSTHIVHQNRVLADEHEIWGVPFTNISSWVVDRELEEYQTSDAITVPSNFVKETFVANGVSSEKINVVPYGVDLRKFSSVGVPPANAVSILYVGAMSYRKGVPYLLQAYKNIKHPRKNLKFIGTMSPGLIENMKKHGLWDSSIECLGHVAQDELKNYFSKSDVLVLPSLEEGLAMVQAQALACGCPVIATRNTGSENLFTHGSEGYIVEQRNSQQISEAINRIISDPILGHQLRVNARQCVERLNGWGSYGDQAVNVYKKVWAA